MTPGKVVRRRRTFTRLQRRLDRQLRGPLQPAVAGPGYDVAEARMASDPGEGSGRAAVAHAGGGVWRGRSGGCCFQRLQETHRVLS